LKSAYFAAAVSLVIGLAALGGVAFTLVGGSGGARPATRSPQIVDVDIVLGSIGLTQPDNYIPKHIVVVIGLNNTARWTNKDVPVAHTVTSAAGLFDSGNMNAGNVWEHTFTQTGTFEYVCTYHPWMSGSVTVTTG